MQIMSTKKLLLILGVAILAAVVFTACAGPAGPEGPAGPPGPPGPAGEAAGSVTTDVALNPETCGICHPNAGDKHQGSYDELYQDGGIKVTNITYRFAAPSTTVITFRMTKDGQPISGASVESLGIYFVAWTGSAFEGEGRQSLKGDLTYDAATGVTTSTLSTFETNVGGVDGLIMLYGRDETAGRLPARVYQAKYPFTAIYETGGGVDYVSAANDDGCVKCHTDPYLKHGYIYAQVNDDPATDFISCKVCHLDNGEGGHLEWQLLVDDPALAAEYFKDDTILTPEQVEQYAYTTRLMNDVHMSHAMEFPYPQSMSNCVTCHEGKLDVVLSDANFNPETCKSCHAVNGSVAEGEEPAYDTTELALNTVIPHGFDETSDCASCHTDGGVAPVFSEIHTGYDKVIYTADGTKYSDAVVVTIDSASFADNTLAFAFSATSELEDLDPASISPTVMVGLYGWDTKDFILGPHERDFDSNNDGTIDRSDARNLEATLGEDDPRITTVSASGGKWEVTADLSAWADLIADGTVKRVEIAVMPELVNADELQLALNAPSRTFDLGKNDFDDGFYSPIVKVADGCNTCHDALATTFHSPDRGGNVVVCRMCHVVKSGGSHLEMQSRSIDSYVHAVHSFQAFDIGDVDFSNPVEAMHYEHHIHFPYPKHGSTDCESCHVPGSYNTPDQSKSLPGLLSASDSVDGRNIGDVPSYVVGPATRACGACHRAAAINEDSAGELEMLFLHWRQGGYMVEAGEDGKATLMSVIDQMMSLFK